MDSDSSSDEELDLMAFVVAAIAIKKRKRKRRVWVREIFQTREADGIRKLVSLMRVSNRDSYFN